MNVPPDLQMLRTAALNKELSPDTVTVIAQTHVIISFYVLLLQLEAKNTLIVTLHTQTYRTNCFKI
jgi:hypothetical protein